MNLDEILKERRHEELPRKILDEGVYWQPNNTVDLEGLDGSVSKNLDDMYKEKLENSNVLESSDKEEKGRCYFNAMMVWNELDEANYVEGYASNGDKAIFHAWNTVEGEIIDVTASFDEYRGINYEDETVDDNFSEVLISGKWGIIPQDKSFVY